MRSFSLHVFFVLGPWIVFFAEGKPAVTLTQEDDSDELERHLEARRNSGSRHLERCGFTKEQAVDVMRVACSCVKRQLASGPEHAFLLLCEAHHNTWFRPQGLRRAVAFTKGGTAGTPLADLIFCIGTSCALSIIDVRFVSKGLQSMMFAGDAAQFFQCQMDDVIDDTCHISCSSVSYVDDTGSGGFCPARSVIKNITGASIVVHETLYQFLFEASYVPGKTEIILRATGPDARETKAALLEMGHVITCQSTVGIFTFRVVNNYKHLGVTTRGRHAVFQPPGHRDADQCQHRPLFDVLPTYLCRWLMAQVKRCREEDVLRRSTTRMA